MQNLMKTEYYIYIYSGMKDIILAKLLDSKGHLVKKSYDCF